MLYVIKNQFYSNNSDGLSSLLAEVVKTEIKKRLTKLDYANLIMVTRIADLDALVKNNLPEERCYQVYTSTIEPNVKSMIESYFKDWQMFGG